MFRGSRRELWVARAAIAVHVVFAVLAGVQIAAHTMAHTAIGTVLALSGFLIWLAIDFGKSWRRAGLAPEDVAKEDAEQRADEQGLTELMRAAANEDLQRVRELLDYGQDPNARSSIGTTALMYAARSGATDIVHALVEAGADVHARSTAGSTASQIAERFGHAGLADWLNQVP